MLWRRPTQEPIKQLAIDHRIRSRCLSLGNRPLFSPSESPFSIARDIISTVISWRRWLTSMSMDSALTKPATGALMRSSLETRLRIKHNVILYRALKNIRNRPNRTQSVRVPLLRLVSNKKVNQIEDTYRFLSILAGLAINTKFLNASYIPKPIAKFLEHLRIVFSKQPCSCWHTSLFLSKASGKKRFTINRIDWVFA